MENYIFFIGGSGARVYRSLLHSAASGILKTQEISVLMIDADKTNKANDECIQLYRIYKNIFNTMTKQEQHTNIFSCNINMYSTDILSPINENVYSLQQSIGSADEDRIRMLKALYTKKEREQNLEGGFYAHPNIGCVFFFDFHSQEFEKCLKKIDEQLKNNKEVSIALVGSIFGGTGAAGIPTLHKLIFNRLKDNPNLAKLNLGGIFLTPYFKVGEKCMENSENIPVHMEEFYFNTYEALQYYQNNTNMQFGSIYLIGQGHLDIVNNKYADSGVNQDNKAHIVELYAALAIDRFFSEPAEKGIYGLIRSKELNWMSFPCSSDRSILALADFARTHAFMVSEIYPYVYKTNKSLREKAMKWGIMIPQWYAVYQINEQPVRREMNIMRQYSAKLIQWLYWFNSTYDSDLNLVMDRNIKLFGNILEDVYTVSQSYNNESNVTEESESLLKVIRDKFNTFVDTANNIEYVLDKVGVIASLAGESVKGFGVLGLLVKIASLVSKQK